MGIDISGLICGPGLVCWLVMNSKSEERIKDDFQVSGLISGMRLWYIGEGGGVFGCVCVKELDMFSLDMLNLSCL